MKTFPEYATAPTEVVSAKDGMVLDRASKRYQRCAEHYAKVAAIETALSATGWRYSAYTDQFYFGAQS